MTSTNMVSSSSRTKDVYDGVAYNGIPLNYTGNVAAVVHAPFITVLFFPSKNHLIS